MTGKKIVSRNETPGNGEECPRLPMAAESRNREQCPDCEQCQGCSESRCRMCKKGGHKTCTSGLGPSMTYGQYLEWKQRQESKKQVAPAAGPP